MKYTPHSYQTFAEQKLYDNPAFMLLMGMGLGKTVVTLTALDNLMFDFCSVKRPLIIAPKFVAEYVWTDEIAKWDHLRHLTVSKIMGDEKRRIEAAKRFANLYIVNRENVAWLVKHHNGNWPYDCVVIDELSSFKSSATQRFKAIKLVRDKITRVIGLTGTPAPNSLMDLWSQVYIMDKGARLGKFVTHYRDVYFNRYGFTYKLKTGAAESIHEKIKDICVSMRSGDWLTLPPLLKTYNKVHLPDYEAYKDFEREQIMYLYGDGQPITAANAAVLCGKLMQFANGAIYDADKRWHELNTAKLDAMEEYIEAMNGETLLVFYHYQHDRERIAKRFGCPDIRDRKTLYREWQQGNVPVMTAHPASIGFGMNMQVGGNHNALWYGLDWGLESYQQATARLWRQGQDRATVMGHLIADGTIDQRVVRVLGDKDAGQNELMCAVQALVSDVLRK